MIKNKTIVIPFSLPWNWTADYQRQTCQVLSQYNQVIAYFPFKANFWAKKKHKLEDSRTINKVVKPYVPQSFLPFERFALINQLNQIINLKLLFRKLPEDIILWIFDPVFHQYPQIVKDQTSLSLYDCVDYHNSTNSKENRIIRQQEHKLIENVDLFVVNSRTLKQIHQKHQPALVPQGFSIDIFKDKIPRDFDLTKSKPIIGYVGGINYRLNYQLLTSLAADNQQWQFVLYGPVQQNITDENILQKIAELKKLANVTIGPNLEKKYIPVLISNFDIGMIPYDLGYDFNRYCYPMKLFEYFYMGKPVISTPIKELSRFNQLVKISNTKQNWEKDMFDLLKTDWSQEKQAQQKQLAISNSWTNKIEAISQLIKQKLNS